MGIGNKHLSLCVVDDDNIDVNHSLLLELSDYIEPEMENSPNVFNSLTSAAICDQLKRCITTQIISNLLNSIETGDC